MWQAPAFQERALFRAIALPCRGVATPRRRPTSHRPPPQNQTDRCSYPPPNASAHKGERAQTKKCAPICQMLKFARIYAIRQQGPNKNRWGSRYIKTSYSNVLDASPNSFERPFLATSSQVALNLRRICMPLAAHGCVTSLGRGESNHAFPARFPIAMPFASALVLPPRFQHRAQ